MKKYTLFLVCSGLVILSAFLITCSKKTDNTPPVPVYPVNCATSLTGSYAGSDICSSSGQATYTCNIISNTPGNITFSNLGGAVVTATVDCASNKITIPTQTFAGNFSISGTGTYTANRIIITWTGNSPGSIQNCTTYYTR